MAIMWAMEEREITTVYKGEIIKHSLEKGDNQAQFRKGR